MPSDNGTQGSPARMSPIDTHHLDEGMCMVRVRTKKISVLFTVFRYPCRSHGQSGRQRGTDHLNITAAVALDRAVAHLLVVDLDLVAVLGRAHIVLEVGRGRGRHMAAGLGLQRHQVIGSELLQRALGLLAQVAEKDITM